MTDTRVLQTFPVEDPTIQRHQDDQRSCPLDSSPRHLLDRTLSTLTVSRGLCFLQRAMHPCGHHHGRNLVSPEQASLLQTIRVIGRPYALPAWQPGRPIQQRSLCARQIAHYTPK